MFVTYRTPCEDGKPYKVFGDQRAAVAFAKGETENGAEKVAIMKVDAGNIRAAVAAVEHEEYDLIEIVTPRPTEREKADREKRAWRQELKDLMR